MFLFNYSINMVKRSKLGKFEYFLSILSALNYKNKIKILHLLEQNSKNNDNYCIQKSCIYWKRCVFEKYYSGKKADMKKLEIMN